jgi:glycosyltransferase involved in cell wall biosynthesis
MTKVSVIMPVYNSGLYLREAMESIKNRRSVSGN